MIQLTILTGLWLILWILIFFNYSSIISYRNIEKIARPLFPLMNLVSSLSIMNLVSSLSNNQGLSFYKGNYFSSAHPLKMQGLHGTVLCNTIREKGFSLLPLTAGMEGVGWESLT